MSQELSLMLDAAMGRYRAADAAGDADGRAQAHRDMTEIVAAMRIGQARNRSRLACDDTAALCGVAGWVAPW